MPTILARLARAALRFVPVYNGKGRLIDRTRLARIRFREEHLDVRMRGGFTLRVAPNDLIGRHLYLRGEFDKHVVDALVQLAGAEADAVLWDIGANIGSVSASFLARRPMGRALAVEPLADVYELLRHNLAQFPSGRGTPLRAAISDRPGTAMMVRAPWNTAASQLDEAQDRPVTVDPVRVMKGDELLDVAPERRVDVLKIDVEGHEGAVIKGLSDTLRTSPPRGIVFEHYCEEGRPDGQLMATLRDAGYSVLRVARRWDGWKLVQAEAKAVTGFELASDFVAARHDVSWQTLGVW